MPSKNNDVIVIQGNENCNKVPYYKQTIPVNLHHFYITQEIGEPSAFLDLIDILKTAEEHDTIFIYLNTPGGSLQTTVQIISAIRQSKAIVVTCLEGEVCSAGTLIFLAGNKHIVNPNCTFMIHNYSHWVGGKGNEVALRVKYSEQYFRKLALDIYGQFLTEEEIDSIINGRDLWMDSEEVMDRLTRRSEQDEETEEANQEENVEILETVRIAPVTEKPKTKAVKSDKVTKKKGS